MKHEYLTIEEIDLQECESFSIECMHDARCDDDALFLSQALDDVVVIQCDVIYL